jgi:hypothetical protein
MTDVHYRAKSKRITKPLGKVIYRTDAACGKYSEVPEQGMGMLHTEDTDEVTCEGCLQELSIGTLSRL